MIRRLLTSPVFYLLAPVATCAVWLVHGSSYRLRGFNASEFTNVGAWLLLIVFCSLCAGLVRAGSRIGRALETNETLVVWATSDRFQHRFSVVITQLAVGALYSIYLAHQQRSIIEVLTATQGNGLKQTIDGVDGIANAVDDRHIRTRRALRVAMQRGPSIPHGLEHRAPRRAASIVGLSGAGISLQPTRGRTMKLASAGPSA